MLNKLGRPTIFFAVILVAAPLQAGEGPEVRERWEALYMGTTKVGHAHTVVDRVESGGQTVWRLTSKQKVDLSRFRDRLEMEIGFTTYETEDGRLYAFDSVVRQPGNDIVAKGRLDGAKMKIEQDTLGAKQNQSLAWGDDVVGLAKIERDLRDKPLKKGEVRKSKSFAPGVNQIVESAYTALGPSKVKLHDGKERELLSVKMEQKTVGEGPSIELPPTEAYLDDAGETIKSQTTLTPGLTLTTYKTTRADALAGSKTDEPGVDFGFESLLKVGGLTDARRRKAVTYKLSFKDDKGAKSFPSGGAQQITKRDGNVLTVRVERRTPPPNAKAGEAAAEFSQPNGFIQSDDAEIVKVAKTVEGVADPWKRCQELERWVRANMNAENERGADFSVGFSTAADTVRSKRGDCSEHSVLLTALCRAAGVPARAAMGLVYVDSLKAFGYHMWTEVNIGGEWYALDGTIGEGSVGAEHLKILDGSLKGASAMGALLPIFQVMGKLEIKVEGVE